MPGHGHRRSDSRMQQQLDEPHLLLQLQRLGDLLDVPKRNSQRSVLWGEHRSRVRPNGDPSQRLHGDGSHQLLESSRAAVASSACLGACAGPARGERASPRFFGVTLRPFVPIQTTPSGTKKATGELLDAGQREALQLAMRALAAGDRSAFNPVFTALWPVLRRFCHRSLRDADAARDAAQTALLKLFLRASDFRADGDVVTWALGFASYECLSARNRTRRRREHGEDALLATVPLGAPSPEERAIHGDLRVAAVEVLGTLRPRDVDTLTASFTDARPAGSNASSRKRLQRALGRLRMAWRQTYGNDD